MLIDRSNLRTRSLLSWYSLLYIEMGIMVSILYAVTGLLQRDRSPVIRVPAVILRVRCFEARTAGLNYVPLHIDLVVPMISILSKGAEEVVFVFGNVACRLKN